MCIRDSITCGYFRNYLSKDGVQVRSVVVDLWVSFPRTLLAARGCRRCHAHMLASSIWWRFTRYLPLRRRCTTRSDILCCMHVSHGENILKKCGEIRLYTIFGTKRWKLRFLDTSGRYYRMPLFTWKNRPKWPLFQWRCTLLNSWFLATWDVSDLLLWYKCSCG